MKSTLSKIIASFTALLLPIFVKAQLQAPDLSRSRLPDLTSGRGLAGFIEFLINTILLFAGLIAVLAIIIGGFEYITSGGNEKLAERGKKTLTNAVIGLVIIIVSYTIVRVIMRLLNP